jgi:hypothetical protein
MKVWVITTTRQYELLGNKTSATFLDSVWSSKTKATKRFQEIRNISIDVILINMYRARINTLENILEEGGLFRFAPSARTKENNTTSLVGSATDMKETFEKLSKHYKDGE